ncbi:hypothetical protein G7B40_031420 [Aetokthonos hydrillicola Thurmond2011]|uniref:Uncharacterized protein n=1 Tax=Aetokthonos hydrillicola Thurmond2011 TaxID=2712845 RepID=A0AAP5ICK7_9CYAN|nr:hypothetical protein [Aetokthonos hydrillicola]MBO3464062.1 hypothetical protein [Aetokthonos hydrillicola CCALA 1050]MBW4590490.1 hypothetical protein [Aetokthonos hydrillicola CCALA 1050]MDR9899036.1 hypothetical protein [Aetokthonos hydrillicola Thurmond2011]
MPCKPVTKLGFSFPLGRSHVGIVFFCPLHQSARPHFLLLSLVAVLSKKCDLEQISDQILMNWGELVSDRSSQIVLAETIL